MKRIRFSLRGLLVAFGVIALGLPVALVGLFGVLQQLNQINIDVATVRNAQINVATLLRCQLDEQLGVRAFQYTAKRAYLLPYRNALAEFDQQAHDLRAGLTFKHEADAARYLDDAIATNARWRRVVAAPILAGDRKIGDIEIGANLVARFRFDVQQITALVVAEYRYQLARRSQAIAAASTIGFSAIALIGVQALVFAFLLARLRYALDREHGVAEALQVAFAGTVTRAPALEAATAYLSATRGAKVGGDVYDVYRVDEDLTLVLIADVSGKGVGAAVDTMFVKYSLRAFATEHRDIAVIANKFNALYANAQKEPEAFVALFCGFYDRHTRTLSYINAGHEGAYVCRPGHIEQLAPTDAIVGLAPDIEFHVASALLDSQSILFLATDGLTEARDKAGRFLGGTGLTQWLHAADMRSPQALVTDISNRLRRYAGATINDDLAILALRPRSTENSET